MPIEQSEAMARALRTAGVPWETLFIRTEGHGFFVDKHRQQFFRQLLGFLDRNIGAGSTTSTASAAGAPEPSAAQH